MLFYFSRLKVPVVWGQIVELLVGREHEIERGKKGEGGNVGTCGTALLVVESWTSNKYEGYIRSISCASPHHPNDMLVYPCRNVDIKIRMGEIIGIWHRMHGSNRIEWWNMFNYWKKRQWMSKWYTTCTRRKDGEKTRPTKEMKIWKSG